MNVRAGAAPRRRSPGGARVYSTRRRILRGAVLLLLVAAAAIGVVVVATNGVSDKLKEITLPLRHEDIIRQQASEKGLDPALVAAVIFRESKFRNLQRSEAGAVGLMQILPATGQFIASRSGGTRFELTDLDTPQVNIAYGCWYLRYLRQRYGGNDLLVLAAYNAGEGKVDSWRADAAARGEDLTDASQIPLAETRAYVQAVLKARDQYRVKYPRELGIK